MRKSPGEIIKLFRNLPEIAPSSFTTLYVVEAGRLNWLHLMSQTQNFAKSKIASSTCLLENTWRYYWSFDIHEYIFEFKAGKVYSALLCRQNTS